MADQEQPTAQRRMKREDATALAIQLANAGRVPAAENLTAQLMEKFPGHPDVLAVRAFVLHGMGRVDDAIGLLEQGLAANPNLPVFHSNLCEMNRQRGDLYKASAHGAQAVAMAPNYAEAHNNLGIVQFEQQDYDAAQASYEKAVSLNPDFAEAHNNLGNLFRIRENFPEGAKHYEQAIALNPNYVEALTNAGKAYLSQQEAAKAEALFRRATEIRPEHMDALTGIAAASHAQGNSNYALTLLSRLTTQYPKEVDPFLMMGNLLIEDHKLPGAEAAVKQALALDPESARSLALMGRLKREMGHTEESIDWFKKALEQKDDAADILNQIGVSHMELGEMDEAKAYFERAIGIAPDSLRIYTNLANAKKFTKDDPHYQAFLQAAEQNKTLTDHEKIGVHYALGKVFDDVGESERAMAEFIEGAKYKRAELDYNPQASLFLFDRIAEVFTKEAIEAKKAEVGGHTTDAPVFVLGMPRSGSTLTEQIISSHSQVFGAGEIRSFNQAMTDVIGKDFSDSIRYPEVFQFLSDDHMTRIADGYLANIPNWTGGEPRFTDKMLTNFFYVGLIHIAMPNAKIIHIRRNPIDNCVSCFTKLFREDLPYSYDFNELAAYYKKYDALMAHWKAVLPKGAYYEQQYEDLVADVDGQARALLDFAGLDWEDQCLEFYDAKRPVKTASVAQVREPIYTRSVERWKKYGTAIQPLVNGLDEVI